MKKILLLIFCCALECRVCIAQAGEWTWMKGENSFNSSGTFGTLGVPDVANTPPALYGPISWTDLTGKFWLYGGVSFIVGVYNALWSFDPDLNIWTWVNGSSIPGQPANYGTIGVPSPNNQPGARGYGAASWTDLNGNLWFYGGTSDIGPGMSDLWKYDIATNEWTCMGLYSFNANHGTKGVAAVSNSPGARNEFNAAWTSDAGDLWFYGGQGGLIMFADVWKYEMSTGNLIWMEGDSMSGIILPVYGSLGVFDSMNNPGSRNIYCHWKDANGKFWIYGGGNPYTNVYADLWQFDPLINQWKWMGGDTSAYYGGNFTTTCDTGNNNLPRCATENRACWVDHAGMMWKMGGAINSNYDITNDLWVYNPYEQTWTWVSGSSSINQNPVYGTQGISDPANVPSASMGSVGWTDQQCNLWFFGGCAQINNSQTCNAMWRYVPDSLCGGGNCIPVNQSQNNFSASSTTLCEKYCIDFYDSSLNNPTAWQWIFIGGNPPSSFLQNPTSICYNLPGTYDVTLITTSANGNDTLTLQNYITVYPTPPFPVITQAGYTLTSSPAYSYQWQLNTVNIPGATNQSYNVLQSGLYTVIIGDSNGCVNSANQYVLLSGVAEVSDANIFIYPNPSSGNFIVEVLNACPAFCGGFIPDEISIGVVNMIGQKVFSSGEKMSSSGWKKEIDLYDTASGVYFIEIKSQHVFLRKKIIVAQ